MFKIILFFFVTPLALLAHNPETLSEDQAVEKLTLKSGQVYENVRVLTISEEGLFVWAGGKGVRIKPEQLPEYGSLFGVVQNNGLELEGGKQDGSFELWTPSTVDDVVSCCLKVVVTKCIGEDGRKSNWARGSAFLVNEKGGTYIYSNVHNFFGVKEFYFEFADGRRISSRECGAVNVAHGKYGLNVKINGSRVGWGGDVIRIRLKKKVEKALTIDHTVLTSRDAGRDIVITGNTGGRGVITKLKGKVTHMSDFDIIHHNAKTESGNSGSPIVDSNTLKVIGILTWGKYNPRTPMNQIWKKGTKETRTGINSGASLARINYQKSSFERLYKERLQLNKMKKDVRILGLLDIIYPTETGLYFDFNKTIMGNYTVADVINESPNHYVVKQLEELSKKMNSNRRSKIKRSKQDMLKIYMATYVNCLKYMSRQRSSIERGLRSKSYYMQCLVRNTYLLDISKVYEKTLIENIAWYKRQLSVRGDALPVNRRIRLPHYRTGISGIGIQSE